MPGTADIIALEVGQSLLPLEDARGRDGTQRLLRLLGWEPPAGGTIDLALDLEPLRSKVQAALRARAAIEPGTDGSALDARYADVGRALADTIARLTEFASSLDALPADYRARTAIVAEFVPRLLSRMVALHLETAYPDLYRMLTYLGVIEVEALGPDPAHDRTDHVRYRIRGDRFRPRDPVTAEFSATLGWTVGQPFPQANNGATPRIAVDGSLGSPPTRIERLDITAASESQSGDGTARRANFDISFSPGRIDINVNSGPVSGGGHLILEPDERRYSGALRFKLTYIHVDAYGVYQELPDVGASFLAVLGIHFTPPIQLGFGFALAAVGGLIGINRRADMDLLRERLSSGAAGNLLFPSDPVENAPALIADLVAFFPPSPSTVILGPTLKLSWLSPIVELEAALAIELPGPSTIIVFGTMRAQLGGRDSSALISLRMDFLGGIDFEKSLIRFDAFLVASHALGIFRLSGGMAFRLNYGPNSYVLLSIGGFHPRFDPGPLDMPRLPRVHASLDAAFLARLYLRLEFYFASTSNTLQIGANVDANLKLGPVQAKGHFRFDALIQFRPFYFDIEFVAEFSVKVFGVSVADVEVEGRINGPGPVVIFARCSIKRLFLKVSGSATFRLGNDNGDRVDPVPSLVLALRGELDRIENLRTTGDDASVRLLPDRRLPPSGEALVSPKGRLIWEQKRVPLRTLVDRFEGVALARGSEVAVSGPSSWTIAVETDWFSPGSFTTLDLKTSQAMNNATFAELESGIGLNVSDVRRAPNAVTKDIVVDIVKRPTSFRFSGIATSPYVSAALAAALRDGARTPAVSPGPTRVTVRPETAEVVEASGAVLASQQTPFQAFQLSRSQAAAFAVPSADLAIAF